MGQATRLAPSTEGRARYGGTLHRMTPTTVPRPRPLSDRRSESRASHLIRVAGAGVLLAALFPLAALAVYVRSPTPTPGAMFSAPRDYLGAVTLLGLGAELFGALMLVGLAAAVLVAFRSRALARTLGRVLAGAAALLALQTLVALALAAATNRARGPLTTGGWTPTRQAPGESVVVVPTFSPHRGISGTLTPMEFDGRAVERLLGRPLPPELRTPAAGLLRRWGIERAFDPVRRVTSYMIGFADVWAAPHSTFDDTHEPDIRKASTGEFGLTPHLVVVRPYGRPASLAPCGEFHRYGLHAGPPDGFGRIERPPTGR